MTVVDIPRASVDLAPGLPSRIVYGTVLVPTEDRGVKGAWIEVSIPGEIKVPGQEATVTGRSSRVPLNVDGTFAVRLPTASEGIEPEDWALSVKMSWRPVAFPMLVPAGADPIWIEECVFPELVPGEDPSQYFLSGAQVRTVETLPPGSAATAKASVVGGMLSIDLGIPQGPQGLPGVTAIEGDEAVAAYISTTGQSATRDALMTTLTTGGTRPVGKGEIVLNARDMGALGDGIADDTAALQAALDASAGRDVFIPHGRYRITSTLQVPSGGVVRGENGTVIVNDADLPTMITAVGDVGPARPLATAVGTNDRTITTASAHGFQAGDIVRFVSQRVSTSADAGEWRLGFSTGSRRGPYFGEHAMVQSVTDATTFVLDSGLVFPSYRPDNSQESDPGAGERATVARVSGARNVVISTLALEGPSSEAIRLSNAVDSLVENIRYEKPDLGRFIQFHYCYRTEARNCWVSNEVDVSGGIDTEGGVDHAAINSYHVTASQSSGFVGCVAISGTQPFDITYAWDAVIPSSFCYVKDCSTYAALANSLTVHPGTYAPVITGNSFVENMTSGPAVRGNRAIISDNVVSGSGDGIGIYISEGGGKDSLISGNHISNFSEGFVIRDGAGKPYEGWIGVVFANNYVVDCLYGYRRYTGWQVPLPTTMQGISLTGNTFVSSLPGAVGVETSQNGRAIWGLTIQGNTFRLTGWDSSTAVLVTGNSKGVAILGNTIWQASRALDHNPATSSTSWEEVMVTEYTGNVVHDTSFGAVPLNTEEWRLMSRDPEPHAVLTPHLDLYTETSIIATGSNSSVTFDAGFPVENTTLIVRTVKRLASNVFQYVELATGEMYFRRRTATSWQAWSKRY